MRDKKKSTHSSSKPEKDPLAVFIKKSNQWVARYFYIALIISVTAIGAFGFSLLYSYWGKIKNEKSGEELYQIKKELAVLEEKSGGAVLKTQIEEEQNLFSKVKTGSFSKEIEDKTKEYIHQIEQNLPSSSALIASSELAHFLYQYKKEDKAVSILNKAIRYKRKNVVGFLLSYQLGSYLIDQKKYILALDQFQFITKAKKAHWIQAQALIKQALIYEKTKELDKAKSLYKQIKKDFPDSPVMAQAEKYLNLIQLENQIKQSKEINNMDEFSQTKEKQKDKILNK